MLGLGVFLALAPVLTGAPALTGVSALMGAPALRAPVSTVQIVDVPTGDMDHDVRRFRLKQDGAVFRPDAPLLTAAEVEELRALALSTEEAPENVDTALLELGITAEAIKAHFPSSSAALELARVRAIFASGNYATTAPRFAVTLASPDGEVVVQSTSNLPLMLPWTVKKGGRSWASWSVKLARALLGLRKLEGVEHLDDGVWQKGVLWDRPPEVQSVTVQTSSFLSGPELAHWRGESKFNGTTIELLPATSDNPFDAVTWGITREDAGRESRAVSEILALARKTLTERRWLMTWKKADPGRTLELHVSGGQAVLADRLAVDRAAWHDAGLRDLPVFSVVLHDSGAGIGELVFGSSAEDIALAVLLDFADSDSHGYTLGGVTVDYRKDKHYVLIAKDGSRVVR